MRLLVLAFSFVLTAYGALAGGADIEQRSGEGWISFHLIPTSPDYAFLRRFIENMDDHDQSMEYSPWTIDELKVGYYDLNDDGVEEMFLYFADAASFYCGSGGCSMILFQRRDGEWHKFEEFQNSGMWVSGEKIGGYHTLYDGRGVRLRWNGREYRGECLESVPAEVSNDPTPRCRGPNRR